MDKEEAVTRLTQTESELREINYEQQVTLSKREDLLARLKQVASTAPAAEVERLRYLIGQCDLQLDVAKRRREYLERRGAKEFDDIKQEQQLRPWLKPKLKR